MRLKFLRYNEAGHCFISTHSRIVTKPIFCTQISLHLMRILSFGGLSSTSMCHACMIDLIDLINDRLLRSPIRVLIHRYSDLVSVLYILHNIPTYTAHIHIQHLPYVAEPFLVSTLRFN